MAVASFTDEFKITRLALDNYEIFDILDSTRFAMSLWYGLPLNWQRRVGLRKDRVLKLLCELGVVFTELLVLPGF